MPRRWRRRSSGRSIIPTNARASAPRRASTGRQYDIGAFVRKMERLYTLLHDVSRATRRRGVLRADLSFLATGVPGDRVRRARGWHLAGSDRGGICAS